MIGVITMIREMESTILQEWAPIRKFVLVTVCFHCMRDQSAGNLGGGIHHEHE